MQMTFIIWTGNNRDAKYAWLKAFEIMYFVLWKEMLIDVIKIRNAVCKRLIYGLLQ